MEEEKKEQSGIYHRNGQVEDMKDMPKQQVERHDGLPTLDELKKLLGKEEVEPSESDKLSKFIEVIVKIK